MVNRTLARKIIEQKAKVSRIGDGWNFDLRETIGEERSFYEYGEVPKDALKGTQPPTKKITKDTATKMAIDWLTEELDAGNVVLSDTWAKDNKLK